MIITRTIFSPIPNNISYINDITGFIRSDIWRRYGALKNLRKSTNEIRKEIFQKELYNHLPIDGVIRNETVIRIIDDILMYKAAAKAKVRKAIFKRTKDEEERRRLFTLLKADRWLEDSFLHRLMRKHFKHGKSSVTNQFMVGSNSHTEEIIDSRLTITIKVAKKYGTDIILHTTTNGTNVPIQKRNLRIITKDDHMEIHYPFDKPDGNPSGDQVLGIDKGYTEAFTDSDGDYHGMGFGKVMTTFTKETYETGKARNKLHALHKKHLKNGNIKKANNILENNLGKKKLNNRRSRTKKRLRDIAFKAAHSIVNKASVVVSEDLTSQISKKNNWRKFNRTMNSWAKGVLAEALDSVCKQRDASHTLVNSAYTSQIDSKTGYLKGKRVGDRFYRENGDVLQADHNAALNVLARLDDPEITRYMPYKEVRKVLLRRSSGITECHKA